MVLSKTHRPALKTLNIEVSNKFLVKTKHVVQWAKVGNTLPDSESINPLINMVSELETVCKGFRKCNAQKKALLTKMNVNGDFETYLEKSIMTETMLKVYQQVSKASCVPGKVRVIPKIMQFRVDKCTFSSPKSIQLKLAPLAGKSSLKQHYLKVAFENKWHKDVVKDCSIDANLKTDLVGSTEKRLRLIDAEIGHLNCKAIKITLN